MTNLDLDGLWAVVVNWNGGEQNAACLSSLLGGGIPAEHIVFVDNASSDQSFDEVRRDFLGIATITNESNLGFGEGANQGARYALDAGASSVLFANNDVTFPADVPRSLVEVLSQDPKVGIVGPRVLYAQPPARVWCAGGMMTWRQNLSTLLGHGAPDAARWQERRHVDYIAGCAMLVRREVFDAIGMLDPSYFAYMEDVDFCVRASAAGFQVLSVGELACHHEPSSATGGGYNPRRKYMQGVNSIHFLRRHGGLREWLRFGVFDVLSLPPLWLVSVFRGRQRAVLAKGLGILHGLRGLRVTADRLQSGATPLW
ncbi:MAG: GT2 family glycosyltransferase [Chlamydiales bacterium]